MMARIVLGAACSRSAMLSIPPELWVAMGERDTRSAVLRDRDGAVLSYQTLAARTGAALAAEVTQEAWARKHAATQQAMGKLAEAIRVAAPDVILMMGDDEDENIHSDNRAPFLVYWGDTLTHYPHPSPPETPAYVAASLWAFGDTERTYPVAADLAKHLLSHVTEQGFDIASSDHLPPARGMAHGFSFMYRRLLEQHPYPLVPVIINAHYPPTQPLPGRCYSFGQAARRALEAWPQDLRVAVIATGGMSIGILDEELDRRALAAMQHRDVAGIAALPRPWLEGRSGEVNLWIATAGACEELAMEVVDYIPGYRSAGGTGCGLGFALWR